jgi:Pentapeptide repeats (8 copies)
VARTRLVRLARLWLTSARFTSVRLTGIRFTSVQLTGMRLTGMRLTGMRLTGMRLTGIRLTGIRLTGIRLTGIRLTPLRSWPTPPVLAIQRFRTGAAAPRAGPVRHARCHPGVFAMRRGRSRPGGGIGLITHAPIMA